MTRPRKPNPAGSLGRPWRRLMAQVVSEEPLCRLRLPGCTHVSTTADHIIPRKYRPDLQYVRSNLRGSCASCNIRRGTGSPSRMAKIQKKTPTPPPKALRFFE